MIIIYEFHFKVLLRKIPTISELWKKLSGKKEKMFPEDFQESMCKLGLNLSKMEVSLKEFAQKLIFERNRLTRFKDSIVFLLMG